MYGGHRHKQALLLWCIVLARRHPPHNVRARSPGVSITHRAALPCLLLCRLPLKMILPFTGCFFSRPLFLTKIFEKLVGRVRCKYMRSTCPPTATTTAPGEGVFHGRLRDAYTLRGRRVQYSVCPAAGQGMVDKSHTLMERGVQLDSPVFDMYNRPSADHRSRHYGLAL